MNIANLKVLDQHIPIVSQLGRIAFQETINTRTYIIQPLVSDYKQSPKTTKGSYECVI